MTFWFKGDFSRCRPTRLYITNPPCSDCVYWKPHVKIDYKGDYDGIRCCTRGEMFHDFSCYEAPVGERPAKEKDV